MPTILQEKVFKRKREAVRGNKPANMKKIILEAGGSLSTANKPKSITQSKGWEMLKNQYADDEKALLTLNELADSTNDDKDNRLKASTEILKLNDRYPASKSKVIGLFDKLSDLEA